MKNLIFVVIAMMSLKAQAHQVEWVRHSIFGPEQVVIKYKNKKSLLFLNTNYFQNKYPARLGYFESAQTITPLSHLQDLSQKKINTPPNPKLLVSPHVAKIFLDNQAVPLGSSSYKQLLRIIEKEIQSERWKFVEGQEVTFKKNKDLKISHWKTHKNLMSQERSPASVCERKGPQAGCLIKAGIVYPPAGYTWKK